jgi:hypothetical protein
MPPKQCVSFLFRQLITFKQNISMMKCNITTGTGTKSLENYILLTSSGTYDAYYL